MLPALLHHSDTVNVNTVCAQNVIMLYNIEYGLCVNRLKDFFSLMCPIFEISYCMFTKNVKSSEEWI